MLATFVLVLACESSPAQDDGSDLVKLRESVESHTSKDQWDGALDVLSKFAASHPSLTEDAQYKLLLRKCRELAQESDRLFKERLGQAEEQLRQEKFAQAIESAAGAAKVYPERQAPVKELQGRARERLAARDMIRIPGIACWIGSDDHADERPLREVKLPAFLIDKYPVTAGDYAAFLAATGGATPGYWNKGKPPKGKEDLPMVYVRYEDAAAYAVWARKRLPTAEEWEVAARGSDRREFPWGKTFLENEERFPANCLEYWQVNKTLSPTPTPVQLFASKGFLSPFGASMGGNVWEWTSTSIPGKVAGQPAQFRILKGGSFMTSSRALRCASLLPENPELAHPDTGFRCAKDVQE